MTTFAQLLDQQRDGARPYLTWLTPQFRTELSVATFANGARKAGNALLELGCDAGSRVHVDLPWHWQRAVWSAGAWLVGATVIPGGEPQGADLLLIDTQRASLAGPAPVIAAVSMHPLGLAQPVPVGVEDAVTIARSQPDVFIGAPAPDGDGLILEGTVWTQSAMADVARDHAEGVRMGIYDDALSWITTVWIPVVSTTSVVMLEDGLSEAAIQAEGLG